MTTTKLLSVMYLAVVATICLATQKLFAQDPEGNPYSPVIAMTLANETTESTERTSHNGMIDPVGLRLNERAKIALYVPSNWANYPVGIAPLDGGEVFASENLSVDAGGTVNFGFMPGTTPGLYRVVVTIGDERYHLQLYLPRPSDYSPNCVNP